MSEENLELTLLLTDAFNRDDVGAVLALWDDEGAWRPAIEGLAEGQKIYRGHAGMRQYYRDLADFARDAHVEWSEGYDLGEQVLVLGRLSMTFASGLSLDDEVAGLFTWRSARCVDARGWMSHADALEAVGI
jgi:ketosteroid isomerase-like protein